MHNYSIVTAKLQFDLLSANITLLNCNHDRLTIKPVNYNYIPFLGKLQNYALISKPICCLTKTIIYWVLNNYDLQTEFNSLTI